MADGCEVLATLEGGVPSRGVGARRLLDVFHLHFLVMDPEVRRPQVFLAALPFADTVGGPFPAEQNKQKANERACTQRPSLSFLWPWKLEAGRENEVLPGGVLRSPGIGRLVLAACLFPLELHPILGDVVLGPQGLGCLTESAYCRFPGCKFEPEATVGQMEP